MTNIWDSTRGYCHTLVLHTLWLHEYAYNTILVVVLYNFMGLQRRACAIISEGDVIWTL